ncbi:hypothetical protein DHEL01_v208668 [Diaporthe helianthi]|uniref:Uncharacterized protein n=1 Tax=Diaporthe helianthi TaxID=158607 RepID=A0A2P5HRS6_DIAHE|nr:hypothetical protein DHEL01_v208668 [Diaporthe helianthi]
MAPNNNGDSGADDFVLIDNPGPAVSVEDVYRKTPIDGGYVKVVSDKDDAETKTNKPKIQNKLFKIEGFGPMHPIDFPDMFKHELLKAADPSNCQQAEGKAGNPHVVLIKNATALFKCFFHFSRIHSTIGRYNLLALVGKACGLDNDFVQNVSSVLYTLSNARQANFFVRVNTCVGFDDEGLAIYAEDADTRELVSLVDLFISFKAEEPRNINANWWDLDIVKILFTHWDIMVESKARNSSIGTAHTTDAGAEINDPLVATSLAVGRLQNAVDGLQARRGFRNMTAPQQHSVKRALKYVLSFTSEINTIAATIATEDHLAPEA